MIRAENTHFALRHNLVVHALQHGIKAAARHFGCARNTVRQWLRRYQQHHLQGLHAHSRAPHNCPHKTSAALERKVVTLRKKTPGFGARRLIAEFDLPLGHNAVNRILRAHGLTRKTKRRHQKKRDLRAIKAAYQPFTRFRMDTKHLTDLPFYWTQMQALGSPQYQYSLRELSCSTQFLAYSNELSKTYATLAADRFLAHLARHGIDPRAIEIRTDLGTEFDGETVHLQPRHLMSGQIEQQWQARHEFNPPHCPNPAVAGPMSRPCTPPSSPDTRCRGWKSPVELLAEKAPQLSPTIFLLHPLPLKLLLTPKGGTRCTGASRKVR